jgi:prefoldin subunit 5
MYNNFLERQADNVKDDISSVIDDLITEIHELEEAHEKLESKIEELEEIIEGLKAQIQELEDKLDNLF